MSVSKDNPLKWIKYWAKFHIRAQGAEAVLFFDNGSSQYDSGQILDCLSRVSGLKCSIVVTAPFPYGPAHGRTAKLEVPSLFFQTAILNLARLRMLSKAKSVLNVDIDEMVLPRGNVSIFEAAENSLLGIVRIAGTWIYCGTPGGHRAKSEHDHRPTLQKNANPKWCVAPSKLAGKVAWTVHRVFGDFDALCQTRDNDFVHCQQNCTNWKVARLGEDSGLVFDANLVRYWEKYLW